MLFDRTAQLAGVLLTDVWYEYDFLKDEDNWVARRIMIKRVGRGLRRFCEAVDKRVQDRSFSKEALSKPSLYRRMPSPYTLRTKFWK